MRLKNLYLENADEQFLTTVADRLDRLVDTPFDDLYDEIADRALTHALKSGNIQRIERAAQALRAAAAERPTARVTRAVLHLAAGRVREAQNHLEGVDPETVIEDDIAEWIAEIAPSLWVLSQCSGGDSTERYAAKMDQEVTRALRNVPPLLRRPLQDYLRLERVLWHHRLTPGLADLPQTVGLRSQQARLLWAFFRALKGFRIGIYRPGPRTARKFEQVLAQAQKIRSTGHDALFRAAEDRLRIFARLIELERSLGRNEPPVEVTRRRLREFLATNHHLLIRLLPEKPPALLGNLEYAWRQRWHDVLDRLGKRFDRAMWSEFYAFRPQVLSYQLVPLNPELGGHRAIWYLRIDRLLRDEKHGELAQFLAKQSRVRSLRPDQLARLWACELWARRNTLNRARTPTSPSTSPSTRSETTKLRTGHGPDTTEMRHTLTRLGEMATSIKRRFAVEVRPEVARVLRDEVLALTAQHGFSAQLIPLAEALLETLPLDLGLMIVGQAAALSSGDGKAQRRFAPRFAKCPSATEDLVRLLPLLRTVAALPAEHAIAILREARTNLGTEGWNRIEGFLRLEVRQQMVLHLWQAAAHRSDEHFGRTATLRRAEQALNDYRSLLGDIMELAAAQVVIKSWLAVPSALSLERTRQFLATFASLEAAVVLFCYVAAATPREHKGLDHLRTLSIDTLIARLGGAWYVWKPAIPLLALRCSPTQYDRLCQRIEELLASGSLTLEESHPLRLALDQLRNADGAPGSRKPAEVPLPRWELDPTAIIPLTEHREPHDHHEEPS